jgi:thiamine-monophosphate kinase
MKKPRNEQAVIQAIERKFRARRSSTLPLPLGDDAALWHSSRGKETILTCDWFLEGTHFLREKHPAGAIGWKCLARATSDIAAMGGKPSCFLLSLALPQRFTGKWLSDFLRGLRRASHSIGCELAGGDTTRSERILISVTVLGEIHPGRAILRSGARPGDLLYASGTLGEAESGLRHLRRQHRSPRTAKAALQKHLYPRPRLELGQWLAEKRLTSAMMDLSDGLSSDLPRLCAASGVGARIETGLLPVTSEANRNQALEFALHGGDDYELLFAVSRRKAQLLPPQIHGVKLTRIGQITRERKILLQDEKGTLTPFRPGGWDPFRDKQAIR